MPSPTDEDTLMKYVTHGFIHSDGLETLTKQERNNLDDILVFQYVSDGIISIDRARSLTPAEFWRLTDYKMIETHYNPLVPIEEHLTLSTRRARVLQSRNVKAMLANSTLDPQEAITLNSSFQFLENNAALKEEVISQQTIAPAFALELYRCMKTLNLLSVVNKLSLDLPSHTVLMHFNPQTSTECLMLLFMIPTLEQQVASVLYLDYEALLPFIKSRENRDLIPFYSNSAVSMLLDVQEKIQSSRGYREYCTSLIKKSFFMHHTSTTSAPESHAQTRLAWKENSFGHQLAGAIGCKL